MVKTVSLIPRLTDQNLFVTAHSLRYVCATNMHLPSNMQKYAKQKFSSQFQLV